LPLPRDAAREARFAAMLKENFDAMWRSLRRLGVPEPGMEDAVQQVLLVAARRFDEIEVGRERPYLLGIALRVASDVRRAARRRQAVMTEEELTESEPGPVAGSSPHDALEHKEKLAQLGAALKTMPDELREAFVLFEIEELSAPQVAEVLDI